MSDNYLPPQNLPETPADKAPTVEGPTMAGFEQFLASSKSTPAPEPTPPVQDTPTAPPTSSEPDFFGQTNDQQQQAPPESDPQVDDAPPNTTEKGKYKWGELRKKAEERDEIERKWQAEQAERASEREELRKQLEELQKEDPKALREQIEAERKAREDYERRLAEYDITQSSEFQQEILVPLNQAGAELTAIAQSYDVDPEALLSAVRIENPSERRKKIAELSENFSAYDITALRDNERRVQEMMARGKQMQANAFEAKRELEYRRQQEEQAKQETLAKNFETARQEMQKQILKNFDFLNEDKEIRQKLATVRPSDDPMRQIFAEGLMQAMPAVNQRMQALAAENAQLKQEIAKRAQVGVRAGQGTPPTPRQQQEAHPLPANNSDNSFQMDNPWARFQQFTSQQKSA